MADSTADFTKKILVDIELKSEQVKKDIPVLTDLLDKYNQELAVLKASQKELDGAGQKNSTTYRANTRDIVDTTQAIRQLKTDIRDANKYIDNASKAINSETNSIQQNRAALSLVTADVIKLGQADGKTAVELDHLTVSANQLTETLKVQEAKIGQTYRNVGNYTESINKSNLALQKGGSNVKMYGDAVSKGFGFLPQAAGGAATSIAKLGGVYDALTTSIQSFTVGFKTQTQLIQDAKLAEDNLAKAKANVLVATEAETAAQDGLTAGTVSNIAAQSAAVDLELAQTAALTAQTVATTAATAATEAGSAALRVFKIALASTGIGLFIVAIASLAEYFTNTNDGAREFEVISARLGAALDILRGQMANFGREIDQADKNQEKAFGSKGQSLLAQYGAEVKKVLKDISDFPGIFKKIFETVEGAAGKKVDLNDFGGLKERAKLAADTAEALTRERQRLTIAEREYNNTTKISLNNELNVQRARIRNLHYTTDERQAAAESAKKISKQVYDQDLAFALESQKIIEGQQALRAKAGVKVDKVAIAEAKGRILTIQGQYQQQQEMLDAREARVDKLEQTEAQKRAQALLAAEQLRKESIAREQQAIFDDYGDKAVAADAAYNKELGQLKKLYLSKRLTTQEYNSVAAQLQKEHGANINKIIEDFQKQDYDKFVGADNQLRNLQIANIQDDTQRTISGLQQRGIEQNAELDKQAADHTKNVEQLNIEIDKLHGKEQEEAISRRDYELLQIQIIDGKRIEQTKLTEKQIADIKLKAANDQITASDSAEQLKAKRNSNVFTSGGAQNADIKAIDDKYNYEIARAAEAGKSTELLEQQHIDALAAINKQYLSQKWDYAVQGEQAVQSAVFDILSQNQANASQRVLNDLSARKDAELANTSLTNTQKQLINNKYANLEKQEKVRAFKENQKLQVANALVNGAVAITKTIAEMGFLPAIPFVALTAATTAFSIAKILSAKPAFAQGGQFESDGKGAVLPGYSRTDNTNARLRSGEAVVVSEAMRVPWARNEVSRINEMFGGRSFAMSGSYARPAFATGGIFTDGGNANRYYSQPVVDAEGLANTLAYQLINNFPPVFVDVKDINNQQGILAATQNRVVI